MSHERRGYREILTEFINIYQSEPCLWQMKNEDYHNKLKKKAAYYKLIEQLKQIEPSANRDMVVRKINSLRTNYRKENKKVEDSLRSGSSSQEVYVPTLWYFDLMKFLDGDHESTRRRSIDDHESLEFEEVLSDSMERESVESDERADHLEIPSTSLTSRRPRARKRKITCYPPDSTAWSNETLQSVSPHFTGPLINDDRFDIFGKNIAMKLRDLPKQQRLIAEKIINDTLFQAEMGILTFSKNE